MEATRGSLHGENVPQNMHKNYVETDPTILEKNCKH